VTAAAFGRLGATVVQRPSPWRLEADSPLAAQWLRGWLEAARQQRPDVRLDGYVEERLARGGTVRIGHSDLLANFV
jgi:hypothetical protein